MIYQIDYSAASSGKMLSMSKRRIRWRWGIANEEALEQGKVGVDCRGFEHEATLVWSITSGKRLIIHDGREVHYSVGRRGETKFQHSWNCNNHIFTVIAYASTPLNGGKIGFKQFELLIDGLSYDSFPRIYELGTSSNSCGNFRPSSSLSSARRSAYAAHHRSARESRCPTHDQDLQWARNVHAFESDRSMNFANGHGYGNERTNDRSSGSVSSDAQQPSPAPPVVEDLLAISSAVSFLDMESPSNESVNSFQDQSNQVQDYNPNQPPSYEAVWSSIMDAYDSNEDVNCVAPVSTAVVTTTVPDMSNLQISATLQSSDDLTKQSTTSVESPRDVADINGVFNNLVNLDDISSNDTKGYSKDKFDKEQKEKLRTKSLHELKSMHSSNTISSTNSQSKEIMKTHQYHPQTVATNPGSLQPHLQQPQSFNQHPYIAPVIHNAF